MRTPAITLAPGRGTGPVLVLGEPLSFWGGLDSASGRIIDRWHPEHGAVVTGRVLMMPGGRGSSSGSSVLAEAIRLGTAPAAILLSARDAIVTVGALVAGELYGAACPVVLVSENAWAALAASPYLAVTAATEGAWVEDHASSAESFR